MKSFRLHRPKKRKGKGFQAIFKRELTWKEKISKFWWKGIVPILIIVFMGILVIVTHESEEERLEREWGGIKDFWNMIEDITRFF